MLSLQKGAEMSILIYMECFNAETPFSSWDELQQKKFIIMPKNITILCSAYLFVVSNFFDSKVLHFLTEFLAVSLKYANRF